MAAAVVRHAGARHVVVTDPNPRRRALAKKMGATRSVNTREEPLGEVQEALGMKEGFDVGLEMSGNGEAFREMLAAMCHGGKIAMLGIPDKPITIDWNTVIFDSLTIMGIYGREMYETWYKMTVMCQTGLDITPMITHRLAAEEYETGFKALRDGEAAKVILTWAEE